MVSDPPGLIPWYSTRRHAIAERCQTRRVLEGKSGEDASPASQNQLNLVSVKPAAAQPANQEKP